MARGRRPRGSRGGGGSIQAPSRRHARLGLRSAAVSVAAALSAWTAISNDLVADEYVAALGAAGALLLLAGRASLVPPALVALAAAYALPLGAGVDGRAPVVAAALVLIAELAYWSLEPGIATAGDGSTLVSRGLFVAGVTLGALLAGTAMVAATALGFAGGVVWLGVGLAAATATLAVAAVLARRHTG